MMEYTVITAPYVDDLIPRVQAAIQEGWTPIGGIVVTSWQLGESPHGEKFVDCYTFAQTMIRDTKGITP